MHISPPAVPKYLENQVIYRHHDRFAAWPFNNGVFKYTGDEIVVGLTSRYCLYENAYQVEHGYSWPGKPAEYILARSQDGASSWPESGRRILTEVEGVDWRARYERQSFPEQEPVDFKHPDLMILQSTVQMENGSLPYYLISTDRGRNFQGPCRLPWSRHNYVWGRPDYVVRNDGACLLWTTVYDDDECNGRPAAFISRNGGLSWMLFTYIAPLSGDYMRIMPSGVLLDSGEIVVAVRCQKNPLTNWSECYVSEDGGRTWQLRSRVNDIGVPCHLLLLDDGRILATYGYRYQPYGIRAALSEDAGRSWGREIILRDDGGSWDLGYPKSVQLDGGDIVTVYYFNDRNDPVQQDGGVRYIASSRWSVGSL